MKTKRNNHKFRTLVFIKSQYVRDSQAYTGAEISENDDIYADDEMDQNWGDIECPVLCADLELNPEAAINWVIHNMYPNASREIFECFSICSKD